MQTDTWKRSLILLLFFLKIGCYTFGGGWAILLQLEKEFVEKRKWITKNELLELTAGGKALPGIMITNITYLFGYQTAGILGGLLSVVGITIPAIVLLTVVTIFYDLVRDNHWCKAALRGIQCAVVPIIASSALSLGREVLKNTRGKVLCVAALLPLLFTKISNIHLIIIAVLAALVWTGGKKYGVF